MSSATRDTIALCLECPIDQMGGVEVLVRELVRGLAPDFPIILVSDDSRESLERGGWSGLIRGHLPWRRGAGRFEARGLAADLAGAGVGLAHFHLGGSWGWLTKYPGQSPMAHLHRVGVACMITNHLVHPPLEGFTDPARSMAFKLARFPVAWIARALLHRRLEAEWTVSDADCRVLRGMFPLAGSRIARMYHSVLHPEREAGPAPDREPVILCVGTLGPRKGQVPLVEAFGEVAGRLPGWRLVLAGRPGEQGYSDRVGEAIRRSPARDRILLAGQLEEAEIVRLMRTSAIFAMPSLSEGLGLSLQEALYRGCACIGSRVGGIPDLIEDGATGRLVPPGDTAALAAGIGELMADAGLRARFAARGHASVLEKGMTAPLMVARHAAFYRGVLSRR